MNEDFVTFELAKKLQEKGCSVKCLAFYTNVGILHYNESLGPHETYMDLLEMNNNQRGRGIIYDDPTISQVLKWLREEKKIHIGISPQWQYTVYDMRCNPWIGRSDMQNYDDYTRAAIAGIEYVLDNLI